MIEVNPDSTELLFWKALTLIAAACVFGPLFKRLGLGAILGYLAAGVAVRIGFADSFAAHPEELLHFSEFGVVLFLFVIGLELKPATLWTMRQDIFGLGLAQMLVCGAALAGAAFLMGIAPAAALVIGLGLALSSTAIVMRQLDERRERRSFHGRKAFAILLFQDLAIVPLLLMVGFLASASESLDLQTSALRLAAALAAIAGLVLVGRYLLDPIFDLLARSRMQEIMTAVALGIVIAAGLLLDLVGASYAMGAFIAGVMLAESAYRHELEANIEPFRGLFLGLFFMAVGLSLDLETVRANGALIAIAAPAAMTLKGVSVYGVARSFGIGHRPAARISLALPQHGEFGFVLFGAAAAAGLFDTGLSSTLVAIISVTMALSPLALRLEPFLVGAAEAETIDEDYSDADAGILVVGFGRFGQIVSQVLFASDLKVTILDNDAGRIREAERFGFRVHFGDGSRRDVLRAAGAKDVAVLVVCSDDPATSDRVVAVAKAEFPDVAVYARSYDRRHSIRLAAANVDHSVRETFESALVMGGEVLVALGADEQERDERVARVRALDLELLEKQVEADAQPGVDPLQKRPVEPEPLGKDESSPSFGRLERERG